MTNHSTKMLLSSTTAVAAWLAAPAMAQPEFADIVVTARRVEERLQDVPISMTVFNQAQLDQRNIVSTSDLAAYTPSLSSNNRYGNDNTTFAIRGFVQEAPTSPSVGVYFAEVIAPRANGGTTGGNGAGVGALFDLQNVQVLKGPQGTLFGRNTTGGAVLLTPHRPTEYLEGYVEGTLGNYDMWRLQGVVNAPVSDRLRVRVGVDRQKRDGYLRNVTDIGPEDFNDVNYEAYRLSVSADITPNLENYIIASYSNSDTNGTVPKVIGLRSPTVYRAEELAKLIEATSGNFYDVANGNPLANQRVRQWQIINTTTWTVSDTLTVKNILSYAEFRQRQTGNIYGDAGIEPGSNPPLYHYIGSSLFGDPDGNNIQQASFVEELQVTGQALENRLTYQVGGYLEHSNPIGDGFQTSYSPQNLACSDVLALRCVDIRGRLTPSPAGGTLEGRIGSINFSRSRYTFRNYGLYAQGSYDLTPTVTLTAGLRYTWDRTSGTGQSLRISFPQANLPHFSCANPPPLTQGGTSDEISANPALCNFDREARSDTPTWLINLDYKPVEDVMLYAKYARGYRQGSVNVSSYGLEQWEPETVDTYEIGAKTGFDGAISGTFNIAAFYNDFRDQQVMLGGIQCRTIELPQCPFIPSPTQGIANAGKSTIKGIEVDTTLRLFEGFRLDASYAYLDSKLKELDIPPAPPGFLFLISAPTGGPLSLTPKHKTSITASYTLPLDESMGSVTVSGTYTYQSTMFGSTSASPDYQTLPSQELVNLNLNWNDIASRPIDLSVFVTNLTKEKFWIHTPGSSFGYETITLNQPRMFGVRVRYRFGE